MSGANLFAGMGGHQSARPQTEEWLTPPGIIDALGGAASFDLDPCAPDVQPWPTALATFTRADSGLMKPWFGRVWLNPPYTDGVICRWLARLAEHDRGVALIFARTETNMFFRHVWDAASALLFLRGRLNFHYPNGRRAKANAGAPSVLCAYGTRDAERLAFCGINGQFVPLRLPRGVLIVAVAQTWREALSEWLSHQSGPVALADIYRAFARHPKARRNPNFDAKIRQVLQAGPFRRVARGKWAAA